MRGIFLLAGLLPVVALAAPKKPKPETQQPTQTATEDHIIRKAIDEASCSGEYADAMLVMSNEARELERRPEANYSYCVRNTATYECLSYGADGKIKRRQITVVAHGTAFAYREKNGEYYLLTNDHVASWPFISDDEHDVPDVPVGCKKIDEQLRLVRDENDDYEPGQIPVQKVVTDPYLDAAVLKTRQQLNIMPYRIGRSALLKAGNVVQIRGYPLGLLEATNSGKIVSASDPDREHGWYHTDFVTDALVTKGNSGSPVFAISCRTGTLELVGLYHAGYRESPALNVAIGIDQLRDLMDNFRKSKPPTAEARQPLDASAHKQIVAALQDPRVTPYFKVGGRMARARMLADGHIAYEIYNDAFPAKDVVDVTLEETPSGDGTLQAFTVIPDNAPVRRAAFKELDAEAQQVTRDLHDLVQRQFLLTLTYRSAVMVSGRSREAFRHAADLAQQLSDQGDEGTDLLKSVSQIASRMPIIVGPVGSTSPHDLPKNIADLATQLAHPGAPPAAAQQPAAHPAAPATTAQKPAPQPAAPPPTPLAAQPASH